MNAPLRSLRDFLRALTRRPSAPARLASAAGAAPLLEQLEERKLLFTLTVTPDVVDPATGVGTVTTFFGYTIPYLTTDADITPADPEVVTEDFNQTPPNLGAVGPNFVVPQSGLRIQHNMLVSANTVAFVPEPGSTGTEKELRFNMDTNGDRFTLSFVNPQAINVVQSMTSISFDVRPDPGSTIGINANTMTVRLYFRGQVIATFTGAALLAQSSTGSGVGTFTFNSTVANPAFDTFELTTTLGPLEQNDGFRIDNVSGTQPTGVYADLIEGRIFGVMATLTGPAGASARFLDLYDREMVETIALGRPQQSNLALVDLNDNGVPDFNDGIGQIRFSGTDSRTAFTMFGGIIEATETPPDTAEFAQGGFAFSLIENYAGLFDEFESTGFGYGVDDSGAVVGLPPGPGSVIIGSPWVRNNATTGTYNPGGFATSSSNTDFNRFNQGIFNTSGASMASVMVHGVVHGSSQFNGALDVLNIGYFVGTASVAGDLGAFVIGSDAGRWQGENNIDATVVNTGSQLIVGRTLGELAIAGRSLMDVTVVGDINSPNIRPPRDVLRYYEKEVIHGTTGATVEDEIKTVLASGNWKAVNLAQGSGIFFPSAQGLAHGLGFLRNDSLLGAEWVGSGATAVEIRGSLGLGDAINAEDPADVYGFVADGSGEIVVELDALTRLATHVRILDENGRTVAASERPTEIADFIAIRFQPTQPGAYYVVIQTDQFFDADNGTGVPYLMTISGMAPTVLGLHRSGGSLGHTPGQGNTVTLLSGSMGSLRVGVAYVGSGGAEVDPSAIFNFDDADDLDVNTDWRVSTVSVPGTIFSITTGSDIRGTPVQPVTLLIGGDLGTFSTGRSEVVGTGFTQGDLRMFTMVVGRRIGMLDIRGGIGLDNDADPIGFDARGSVNITTGDKGQSGDIGIFRVGGHIAADRANVTTSAGSVIGAFLVSQDDDPTAPGSDVAEIGIYNRGDGQPGNAGVNFNLGIGSDLRFVDFPMIDLSINQNANIALAPNLPIDITDDAGGRVRIRIIDGSNTATGQVRVIPVQQSQGVAIAQIDVSLLNGARLQIDSIGTGRVSIGRIVIDGASPTSSIGITGAGEVDVWSITQINGDAFLEITNQTPGGDIVAIDVASLATLTISGGNLGFTSLPAWGPQSLGVFYGIGGQGGQGAFDPFGIAGSMNVDWNGDLYRPITDVDTNPGNAYLDDIGSPIDPFLNGLATRAGNIVRVLVAGAVGDVIARGGSIIEVVADSDRNSPDGLDGIRGNIYASVDIINVDVGRGLFNHGQTPIASVSIVANDDIALVTATNGANIMGIINAANLGEPSLIATEGLDRVEVTGGGNYINAYIASRNLDAFWTSFFYDEQLISAGNVNNIRGTNADFFRSAVSGGRLVNFTLSNGFFDASSVRMFADIDFMSATGYRNSTLTGGTLEVRRNEVIGGEDLGVLTTAGRLGDIQDLVVDVLGNAGEISARHITRTDIDADLSITSLITTGSLRGSDVASGRLTTLNAAVDIRSSTIEIAGPITLITAGNQIANTTIIARGPDASIATIRTAALFTGSVSAAGPITTIEVTAGDLAAHIATTTAKGNVTLLRASRDLNITTDISGAVSRLVAGRHIGQMGSPRIILVHGDVVEVTATNGQLYSDLRVGRQITGAVTIGAVSSLPGNTLVGSGSIVASGRIATVNITGDFGGDIVSYSESIGSVTILNGSLLPGRLIAAYAGDIASLVISEGHLLGDVYADHIIYSIQVLSASGSPFGNIGISSDLSSGVATTDPLRNQLPAGVVAGNEVNGPRIEAGWNIGRIFVENGSVFEATIFARRAIGFVEVNGSVRNDAFTSSTGSVIAAGDSIFNVAVTGNLSDALVLLGVYDFGADDTPGGIGVNADAVKIGRLVNGVNVGGNIDNVRFSAGMTAGLDGLYNTADDRVAPGASGFVGIAVAGTVTNSSIFADSHIDNVDSRITRGGAGFALADDGIFSAVAPVGTPIAGSLSTTHSGANITITFSGPGSAFWDAAGGRVILVSTTLDSSLIVESSTGALADFDVVSNDDASMGLISLRANLSGNSDIIIDAFVMTLETGHVSGNGRFTIGGDVGSIVTGNFSAALLSALHVGSVLIAGNFGSPVLAGESHVSYLSGGSLVVGGSAGATLNVSRNIDSVALNGGMDNASFRSGGLVGSFTAAAMFRSYASAREAFASVAVNGNMTESGILAGGDAGANATFSTADSGFNADEATSGNVGAVSIAGNMVRSSIAAGALRGPDGFFGTDDDFIAEGLSNVGSVTVTGAIQGSNLNSDAYRVFATGTIGTVRANGQVVTTIGNFRVQTLESLPVTIQVTNVQVTEASRIYTAEITFNQQMNASTLGEALTVSEVRNSGAVTIRLINGVDYTVEYNEATFTARIVFARAITERTLPQLPGQPGPGVYRFELDANTLRAAIVQARLDGDRDGYAGVGDNFSTDDIVGDAGDKLNAEIITVSDLQGNVLNTIHFYSGTDLDLVMDDNRAPDGLPDPNERFTLRGVLGDHPNHDANTFRFAGDNDLYTITLQAGQILRLGAMSGGALLAGRNLFRLNGSQAIAQGGDTVDSLSLPVAQGLTDLTFEEAYLIKTTGTYAIVVANSNAFAVPGQVLNLGPVPGAVGDYRFTVEVFDDGDSGFTSTTDAGDGALIADAPLPIAFAGPDAQFGTPDDVETVQVGEFVFTLDAGPDSAPNTEDDIVSGSNGSGVTSTRVGNVRTSVIDSAIGPAGHTGIPDDVWADVDVFHLNSRQAIEAGTRIRVSVRLSELGADLGSRGINALQDFRGDVQLGIFDTTTSTSVGDALLVMAPSDFSPNGSDPGVLASSATSSYGYDENGDFFFEFVTAGAITGSANSSATYAVYLQGVFNTDYQLVVTMSPSDTLVQRSSQNIFLETKGGSIDWLLAGGLSATLKPFSAKALGIEGSVNNLQADTYILQNLVDTLNQAFAAAGISVIVSTNRADFEFQDFSTIFLTNSNDPINLFNAEIYGYSQHSDPFNTDKNDEGVVFVPALADLGYTPSTSDIDLVVQSLTASVGRRVGELLGLRTLRQTGSSASPVSMMTADSVGNAPGPLGVYRFSSTVGLLSNRVDTLNDTNFFLGGQIDVFTLRKFVSP